MNAIKPEVAVVLRPDVMRSDPWTVGRLVVSGVAASQKTPIDPVEILGAAVDALRDHGVRVRYLLTPAGFFRPKMERDDRSTRGWSTAQEDFDRVVAFAESSVVERLSKAVTDRIAEVASYLVVGVDVPVGGQKIHGETGLVFDVEKRRFIAATGKSYPTVKQERELIRNTVAGNHIVESDGESIAILVCHDLNAWNPRGVASRVGIRSKIADAMDARLSEAHPAVVLHLPHSTHSAQTWSSAWAALRRSHPEITIAASAIKYRRNDKQPTEPLGRSLLDHTRHGDVLDIIVGDHVEVR